ncbi:MAG: SiaB family protein kinase [Bacteroidales bacterium]|nr:SiaB family protein kinase [Bacteroidales bacterium]
MDKAENAYQMYSDYIDSTIISYNGPFDAQVLSVIAENIEYSLSNNPRVSKKIFKIFIELAQNISYYSAEKQKNEEGNFFGSGILMLREMVDHYSFSTGNIVEKHQVLPVIQKCETINMLDREKLRQYKRKLRNMPSGTPGGGNIGLVQVALTADYPLEYEVVTVDESTSFYILNVRVNKS